MRTKDVPKHMHEAVPYGGDDYRSYETRGNAILELEKQRMTEELMTAHPCERRTFERNGIHTKSVLLK